MIIDELITEKVEDNSLTNLRKRIEKSFLVTNQKCLCVCLLL